MSKQEKRFLTSGELRAEAEDGQFILSGYAALFSSPSKDLGFVETIAPTAFDRALREKQLVRLTFQHSLDAVLARTDNGSLELSTDTKGLKFRGQLNRKIQLHSDLFEATKAGLYNEMSFAFEVAAGGDTWSADGRQRTLTDVNLFDVSLVATGAYSNTLATARSANGATALAETFQRLSARATDSINQADEQRQRRAAEVLQRITTEKRKDAAFEAACERACRELDPPLDFCDVDEDQNFIYGSDPNDVSDDCLRFSYEIDANGDLILDESTRTKTKHSLLHTERGRKILFFKRIKRSAGRG